MKRERVYVVERKCFRTWNPISGTAFSWAGAAKAECSYRGGAFPHYAYRVMPYERMTNARPLLVVKGKASNAD